MDNTIFPTLVKTEIVPHIGCLSNFSRFMSTVFSLMNGKKNNFWLVSLALGRENPIVLESER